MAIQSITAVAVPSVTPVSVTLQDQPFGTRSCTTAVDVEAVDPLINSVNIVDGVVDAPSATATVPAVAAVVAYAGMYMWIVYPLVLVYRVPDTGGFAGIVVNIVVCCPGEVRFPPITFCPAMIYHI